MSDIPLGILEVKDLVKRDGIWLPSVSVFTTYRYESADSKLLAEPAIETSLLVDKDTLVISGKPAPDLFEVKWPAGTQVRDEINKRYYIQGVDGARPELHNNAKSECRTVRYH